MASTGQIHFVRSRTVASQEREIVEKKKDAKEEEVDAAPAPVQEQAPVVYKKPQAAAAWVGRKRSDVTRERYV